MPDNKLVVIGTTKSKGLFWCHMHGLLVPADRIKPLYQTNFLLGVEVEWLTQL